MASAEAKQYVAAKSRRMEAQRQLKAAGERYQEVASELAKDKPRIRFAKTDLPSLAGSARLIEGFPSVDELWTILLEYYGAESQEAQKRRSLPDQERDGIVRLALKDWRALGLLD